MSRTRHLLLGAAALASLTVLGGCSDSKELINAPTPEGGEMFRSYVALGNSITAGWQSSGINDSTQKQSYAYLFAHHIGTRFAYPALSMPGCPAPLISLTGQRVGGAGAPTCSFRTAGSATAALNNVAVPGYFSQDPTSSTTNNPLSLFILGGKTQAQRALDADPTFTSVWLGNNDVLIASASGIITPTAGVSPGITPTTSFETNYDAMIEQLSTARHLQGGVLIGVVDVSAIPLFFPAAALFNPQFKAGFDQYAGGTVTILPSCTPTTTAFLSFAILGAMNSGQHPRVVGCAPGSVPGTLVGDIFVLDDTERATISSTVAAYNAHIEAVATDLGWAYLDPNPTLLGLRQQGQVPTVPNLANPMQAFGPYFSVDGVHPSALAHELIADLMIEAIDAKYNLSIPPIATP